jgi:hypothetical protein
VASKGGVVAWRGGVVAWWRRGVETEATAAVVGVSRHRFSVAADTVAGP